MRSVRKGARYVEKPVAAVVGGTACTAAVANYAEDSVSLFSACGTTPPPPQRAPEIRNLSPESTLAGSADPLTVEIQGRNFAATAVVRFNGAVVSFQYIGHDDEFAVARVQYRTVGGTARPFMHDILDTITIFHQEDGAWKYWDNYVLGARPVQ